MRSLLILFLLIGCLALNPLAAQAETPAVRKTVSEPEAARDLPGNPESGGTASEADDVKASGQREQEKDRQKRMVEIGLILTSGIVILGVFLVVVTLLYGRRTKRQLASGRGPSSPRDDLWYLKKSREAPSTNISDAEQERESE